MNHLSECRCVTCIADMRASLSLRDRERLDKLLRRPPPALKREDFLDPDFSHQTDFILDPSKRKVAIATRRSAKSMGYGRYLLMEAYLNPGVSVLYVGLTRSEAKRIMCKDILDVLIEKLGIEATHNKSDLTYTLPNKSVIYIIGVDSSEKEQRKVYGQKFKLVCIDEAALYRADLRELVYGVLAPAMVDLGGTICLAGMPSNQHYGLFFDLTRVQDSSVPGRWSFTDKEFGAEWSGHRWSAWQNKYILKEWEEEIAEKKRINPLIAKTPLYEQEYLGRWVVDPSKVIYKYEIGTNDYETLPFPDTDPGWRFILGVDLGWEDPTAFVLVAYHDNDPTLYIMSTEKKPHMTLDKVAARIHEFQAEWDLDYVAVDGADKQSVQTMCATYGVSMHAAEKHEKWEFIQLMNADFVSGRIMISPACQELKTEYKGLTRDPRSYKPRENPANENHLCDAALYAWRHCYHHLSTVAAKGPVYGSPEWAQQETTRMREGVGKALKAQRGGDSDIWADGGAWAAYDE